MTIKSSDLERLLEVSSLLTSTLELEPLLTKVLEAAESLMEAEASNVMLLDPANRELVYEVALGEAGSQIKAQKRLKMGVGIAGWVAEHGQPLLIEDAYADPRFFPDFDRKTGFHTKSILCLPLKVKGALIGIAQIINKKTAPVFTPDDQNLFAQFCNITAIAIDNAMMHRKLIEQDRLQRDMQLAEEIQRTFLPAKAPCIAGLRIEYRSMACRHVGGDVMDLSRQPDGRLAVLVGDVSGKGVPAALFGARFSTDYGYLRQANAEGGELFSRLNQLVCDRSTRGMFITAVYAVVDPLSGRVQLVNAGHLTPIVVGPGPGDLRLIQSAEFPPLGIVEGMAYQSTEVQLMPGERLVLMTDGVTEAKARDGSRLGDAAVRSALASCPSHAVFRMMNEVRKFTEGEVLADDVTVVGVGFGTYDELSFASTTSALSPVRQFVEERARQAGFSSKYEGRISLAVTEAVANVIKHTYQMRVDGQIQIGVGVTGSELEIHVRDWGPKQDPSRFVSRALDDIRPGGLGIHYMREVMDVVEFDDTHSEGNELHMLINNQGKGSGQ